jgi:hypothetical protein
LTAPPHDWPCAVAEPRRCANHNELLHSTTRASRATFVCDAAAFGATSRPRFLPEPLRFVLRRAAVVVAARASSGVVSYPSASTTVLVHRLKSPCASMTTKQPCCAVTLRDTRSKRNASRGDTRRLVTSSAPLDRRTTVQSTGGGRGAPIGCTITRRGCLDLRAADLPTRRVGEIEAGPPRPQRGTGPQICIPPGFLLATRRPLW